MTDRRLRERLRRTPPPAAEAARRRAREVTLAAYADRTPPQRRRRWGAALPVAVVLLLGVVGSALAAGPPVTDWVRDLLGREDRAPRPAPALARLPAAGRLLVAGPGGTWIVGSDGSQRRLGAYADAAWSPQGLFVAATRGRQLVAVDPQGTVRWALTRSFEARDPRWAPSGYRVAYRSGTSLRVVAGDGSADRLVAAQVRPVAPAWRPGARHELAYVDGAGRVVLTDTETRRTVRRAPVAMTVDRLQWSADGKRLVVSGPRSVEVITASGRTRTVYAAPARTALVDAAVAPAGARVAVVRRLRSGAHEVLLTGPAAPRRLFSAAAAIRSVTWSPDGRIVLADWAGADQWLFLPTRPGVRAGAVARIAAQFDPGHARPRHRMAVRGWCCPG